MVKASEKLTPPNSARLEFITHTQRKTASVDRPGPGSGNVNEFAMTFKEIAEATGLTVNEVRSAYDRGMHKLRIRTKPRQIWEAFEAHRAELDRRQIPTPYASSPALRTIVCDAPAHELEAKA